MEEVSVTPVIWRIVKRAIVAAREYEELTKRKLGITGEIGELLVCKKLKLKLMADSLTAGFDALNEKGDKYQIKTRRAVKWERRYLGRIGSFAEHKFDYAILAILDKDYNLRELYRISEGKLAPVLDRYPRRNPSVKRFIREAKKL